MTEGIGDRFQRETKYCRGKLSEEYPDWTVKPRQYKLYEGVPRIQLEQPQCAGGAPLWTVLNARRTIRHFGGKPVTFTELSQLLWSTQGITGRYKQFGFRTAPSAGALYPVETYLIVHRVDNLDPGIYHYDVESHTLACLKKGHFGHESAMAALNQVVAEKADVVFVWTAVFERCKWKYRQRAYRYIYLDAGHIAGNLALSATALNLGSCQIAGLYDDEVNELLGLDGNNESAVYMTAVGRPKI